MQYGTFLPPFAGIWKAPCEPCSKSWGRGCLPFVTKCARPETKPYLR